MDWGRKELGLEDGAYNWFMMGMREYTCGRCLLSFGCMTARHVCPFCKRDFDYDPADYHRKIVCGNGGCGKEFGFYLFHVSDRREKQVREEQRALVKTLLKKREVLKARAARARGRGFKDERNETVIKERAFRMGLLDSCPRCGYNVATDPSPDAKRFPLKTAQVHLRCCTDKEKHRAYQQRLEQMKLSEKKAHGLQTKQEDFMLLSSWEYQGSKVDELWTLTDGNLKTVCEKYKLEKKGSRTERISRISNYLNSQSRLLTDGGDSDATNTKKRITSRSSKGKKPLLITAAPSSKLKKKAARKHKTAVKGKSSTKATTSKKRKSKPKRKTTKKRKRDSFVVGDCSVHP